MSPRPDQPDDPTPDPAEGTPTAGAAERIIEKFGGIRPMAHKLEIPVTTVQGWKKRGAIPTARHADLLAAATRHGIALDAEELAAAAPSEEPVGEASAETPGPERLFEGEVVDDRASGPDDEPRPVDERAADTLPAASLPAADASRPPEGAAPGSRRAGGRKLAVAATVLSLLALGTALTAPWWASELLTPAFGEPRSPANVAALQSRVDELAARLEAAERPQEGAQSGAGDLAETVSALEARIAEVAETARQATEAARQSGEQAAAAARQSEEQAAAAARQSEEQAAANGEAAAARIAEIEQQLGALASRIPEQPVGTAQLEQQLQELRSTLERNAQTIASLETEANRLASELSGATQRVAGLAQSVEQRQTADAETQALVLAAGQLRAALQESDDFAAELQTLRQLGAEDGEIAEAAAALGPYAEGGIPTRPQLDDRFSRYAPDIVQAGRTADGGEWYDRALNRVTSLVSVRRVGGDVPGDGAAAVVARTEALLDHGNLDAAVEQLSTLQGPAAEAAEPWLAQARARLLAERVSTALTRHAIGRLAGIETSNATSGTTSSAQDGGTVRQ
ncbi:mitofilin family membrane protein [Arenibaculum sp.]|uniref:mitofilin family membrane protein n=1 Tax=Arenibaculum sp. TaxID=2865862 RepID=UPI002E0E813E|nr:mitofilin family membrane protein [Arenibaculum sp.]